MGRSKVPVGIASSAPSGGAGAEPSYRAKFRRLERLVTLLAQGKINCAFLSGVPGIGKTFSCLRTLSEVGLIEGEHFVVCKGHTSPLGLYQNLFTNNGARLVVFDDCDSALSKDGINLIKAALDDKPKRTVSFMSSKLPGSTPSSFDYTGRVLFISNLKSSEIDGAIESRCHCAELHLSRDEIFAFIDDVLLPQPHLETSRAHRQYVLWRMKAALKHSPTTASVRLYRKLLDLWCHDREFFNEHLDALMPRSDDLSMVRRLLDQHDTVGEAAKMYASLSGKSERSFYLLKAKYQDCL